MCIIGKEKEEYYPRFVKVCLTEQIYSSGSDATGISQIDSRGGH